MSWAKNYIDELLKGNTVSFRPRGSSMLPKIKSGQLCHVSPINSNQIATSITVGSVALCRVKGKDYLHLVSATKGHGKDIQWCISNNHGRINGWIKTNNIYGILTGLED